MKKQENVDHRKPQTFIGKLSGKTIAIPDVNVPPMPVLASPGVIQNGKKAETFGKIDSVRGCSDVLGFRPIYSPGEGLFVILAFV